MTCRKESGWAVAQVADRQLCYSHAVSFVTVAGCALGRKRERGQSKHLPEVRVAAGDQHH